MPDQTEFQAPRAAAQAFFDEMAAWETWSLKIWDDDEDGDERREKLRAIFEKYLSQKALKREQSRYESLDAQDPPEFAGHITNVEDAGKDKVWVYRFNDEGGGRVRFLLTNENGQWRIETRESDYGDTGRWKKEPNL